MRTVSVSLGDRSYSIKIGPGLLKRLGPECRRLALGSKCAIVTDDKLPNKYAAAAAKSLKAAGFEPLTIAIPSGERSKNLKVVQQCFDRLAAHRLERTSFIVAVGGGVVGDLAGFVAASYLRGIDFVQVPTTLLAQVDSSVGGKTGVNLAAGKNLVGAFHQPRLVLIDLDTLQSLPLRELRAGASEIVKYGIIADPRLFRRLERDIDKLLARDARTLTHVIARSCEIKAGVVSQDEREGGLRAILNYGHTIGHAIEAISGYGKYLHGEAISIGQVAAAHLSHAMLGLADTELERIRALLAAAGLPTTLRLTPARRKKLIDAMRLDKKVRAGEIKFVLARKIGEADFGICVPLLEVINALHAVSAD